MKTPKMSKRITAAYSESELSARRAEHERLDRESEQALLMVAVFAVFIVVFMAITWKPLFEKIP